MFRGNFLTIFLKYAHKIIVLSEKISNKTFSKFLPSVFEIAPQIFFKFPHNPEILQNLCKNFLSFFVFPKSF